MLDDAFSGWDRGLIATDAHAAYERGEYREAARLYRQALDADADNPDLATRLTSALLLSNRYEECLEAGRSAMALSPDKPAPAVYTAGAALALGDLAQACDLADEALRRDSSSVAALLCKADVLRTRGDASESETLLRDVRTRHPNDPRVLIELALQARSPEIITDVVRDLRSMLETPALQPQLRAAALYALGGVLERSEDLDGAFDAFQQANACTASPFDGAAFERVLDELIGAWTPERFASLPRSSVSGHSLVFIVGMPRTGSTLVEQILSSHPEVDAGGEMPHFARRAGAFLSPPLGPAIDALTQSAIESEARAHLDDVRALAPEAGRLTDKLLTNFFYLPLIRAFYPDAAIIHCTRRPLDTALSCWQHNFRGSLNWTDSAEGIAAFYRAHDRVMHHWLDVVGIEALRVPYEELVSDLEGWSRRLVDHAGLAWDDACLTPHMNTRAVLTSSQEQVREPVHRRAVRRADRYGALLDPLRAALTSAGVDPDG